MGNIHHFEKRLEKYTTRIFGPQSPLRSEDKEDLQKFYVQAVAEGKSAGRILKLLYTLVTLAKLLNKPYRSATKDDIVQLVIKIGQSTFSDWTKRDCKIILRMFYKFLRNDPAPEEVHWIKAKDSTKRLLPDDILTEDDIIKIAKQAKTIS